MVDEDVAHIIADEERAAFEKLKTNEEREKFIEQFWLRRDPTPGTPENQAKEEHYQRIAFANQRFPTSGREGWQTDRGPSGGGTICLSPSSTAWAPPITGSHQEARAEFRT